MTVLPESFAAMPINRLLDTLFRRHGKELLAFAGRQSAGNAAEDIVQEAYLRLLQHPNPSEIENHRAYLFKTAANLSHNQYQYNQVRARHHGEGPQEADTQVSPLPGPEILVDGKLRIELFMTVLAQLPEACQHAFILNKLDGLSYPEVALSLGISAKTAQRYIFKAWQHCLQQLGDDYFNDNQTS